MNGMEIEKALEIVKAHGFKVQGRRGSIALSKKEVARINEMLTIHGRVVITHNGKRMTVFTYDSHKSRMKGIGMIHASRAKSAAEAVAAAKTETAHQAAA